MSDTLDITDLKPGMVILQITKQNGPVKIRKSGLVTSDAMVQGLAEMGVQEVEVDPAQTVEIDINKHHRTETQALIRGERDTSAATLDRNISDQFNRSLFLPTVQGLPSLWKVYAKQSVSFGTVIIIGLVLGFGVGSFPRWWQSVGQVSVSLESQDGDSNITGKPGSGADIASANLPEGNSEQPVAVEQQTPPEQQEPVEQTSDSDDKLSLSESPVVPDRVVTPQPVEATANDLPVPDNGEEPEGEIINAPPEDKGKVSPELLARFNQALEELDNKATEYEPEPQVVVRDDLPRVDQLPVRMLTRLPSMAFNAHMYASRPSDRWVRVNGVQLGEGDWISDEVQIVKIEAQRVILNFEGRDFSMAALTDW